MMKENPYEMSKILELEDKHRQKQAQLAGPFRRSNVFDNNGLPDWTKDSKTRRLASEHRATQRLNRVHTTADKF